MPDEKKAEDIRRRLGRLAAQYRRERKADPALFLKKMDALTREYYRALHPELRSRRPKDKKEEE